MTYPWLHHVIITLFAEAGLLHHLVSGGCPSAASAASPLHWGSGWSKTHPPPSLDAPLTYILTLLFTHASATQVAALVRGADASGYLTADGRLFLDDFAAFLGRGTDRHFATLGQVAAGADDGAAGGLEATLARTKVRPLVLLPLCGQGCGRQGM